MALVVGLGMFLPLRGNALNFQWEMSPKYVGELHAGYKTTTKVYGMNTYTGMAQLGTLQGVSLNQYLDVALGVDAYTDGTREETFILRSGGAGTYKSWDWGDQRYYTTPLTWSASGEVIVISRKATQDYSWSDAYGYINSSGNAMKINGDWYNKK